MIKAYKSIIKHIGEDVERQGKNMFGHNALTHIIQKSNSISV